MHAGASFRFPGGESRQDQLDRVSAALADVASVGERPAQVVFPRGSIRVILCSRDPRGLDAFHKFEIPNVAVLKL